MLWFTCHLEETLEAKKSKETVEKPPRPKSVGLLSKGGALGRGNVPSALLWEARRTILTGSSSSQICQIPTHEWMKCPPNPTQSILITPTEPQVTLDVAGRRMEFLTGIGTACSVLTWLAGHASNYGCTVMTVNGQIQLRWLIFPFTYNYCPFIFAYVRMTVPHLKRKRLTR